MSPTEHVDRSRKAATEEVQQAAADLTRSIPLRKLANELLDVGYQFQFERDRSLPRRQVETLIAAMLEETAEVPDED